MKFDDWKIIAVIGAGDMGHGIAQLALMTGYEVHLCDIKYEYVQHGISRIQTSLEKLVSKGKCDVSVLENSKNGKLRGHTDLSEAVKDADKIVEVVSEEITVKESVLREISASARANAIIASNTSTMSITMLSHFVDHPERFLGMHYFNPAVLMKLVEVVRGQQTSDQTIELALEYVKKIGKTAIYAQKDTPGFVANRINIPSVLYTGFCMDVDGISAEDIDASLIKQGLKMGPIEVLDYTGVDILCSCMAYYHEHLSPEYVESKAIRQLMDTGKFGKKTGEGFYLWVDGKRPVIDPNASTGKFDSELFFIIQANESCKLYEEGVCNLEDCDRAMELGYNTPGPIRYIQDKDPQYLTNLLNQTADRFGCNVFRPTETIRRGKYIYQENE